MKGILSIFYRCVEVEEEEEEEVELIKFENSLVFEIFWLNKVILIFFVIMMIWSNWLWLVVVF